MMKRSFALFILLSLTACEDRPPLATPVACTSAQECDAKWARALAWVNSNAQYPVTTASDTVIATDGPAKHSQIPAIRVEKRRQTNGETQIIMLSQCTNIFRCDPTALELRDSFNQAMGAGG